LVTTTGDKNAMARVAEGHAQADAFLVSGDVEDRARTSGRRSLRSSSGLSTSQLHPRWLGAGQVVFVKQLEATGKVVSLEFGTLVDNAAEGWIANVAFSDGPNAVEYEFRDFELQPTVFNGTSFDIMDSITGGIIDRPQESNLRPAERAWIAAELTALQLEAEMAAAGLSEVDIRQQQEALDELQDELSDTMRRKATGPPTETTAASFDRVQAAAAASQERTQAASRATLARSWAITRELGTTVDNIIRRLDTGVQVCDYVVEENFARYALHGLELDRAVEGWLQQRGQYAGGCYTIDGRNFVLSAEDSAWLALVDEQVQRIATLAQRCHEQQFQESLGKATNEIERVTSAVDELQVEIQTLLTRRNRDKPMYAKFAHGAAASLSELHIRINEGQQHSAFVGAMQHRLETLRSQAAEERTLEDNADWQTARLVQCKEQCIRAFNAASKQAQQMATALQMSAGTYGAITTLIERSRYFIRAAAVGRHDTRREAVLIARVVKSVFKSVDELEDTLQEDLLDEGSLVVYVPDETQYRIIDSSIYFFEPTGPPFVYSSGNQAEPGVHRKSGYWIIEAIDDQVNGEMRRRTIDWKDRKLLRVDVLAMQREVPPVPSQLCATACGAAATVAAADRYTVPDLAILSTMNKQRANLIGMMPSPTTAEELDSISKILETAGVTDMYAAGNEFMAPLLELVHSVEELNWPHCWTHDLELVLQEAKRRFIADMLRVTHEFEAVERQHALQFASGGNGSTSVQTGTRPVVDETTHRGRSTVQSRTTVAPFATSFADRITTGTLVRHLHTNAVLTVQQVQRQSSTAPFLLKASRDDDPDGSWYALDSVEPLEEHHMKARTRVTARNDRSLSPRRLAKVALEHAESARREPIIPKIELTSVSTTLPQAFDSADLADMDRATRLVLRQLGASTPETLKITLRASLSQTTVVTVQLPVHELSLVSDAAGDTFVHRVLRAMATPAHSVSPQGSGALTGRRMGQPQGQTQTAQRTSQERSSRQRPQASPQVTSQHTKPSITDPPPAWMLVKNARTVVHYKPDDDRDEEWRHLGRIAAFHLSTDGGPHLFNVDFDGYPHTTQWWDQDALEDPRTSRLSEADRAAHTLTFPQERAGAALMVSPLGSMGSPLTRRSPSYVTPRDEHTVNGKAFPCMVTVTLDLDFQTTDKAKLDAAIRIVLAGPPFGVKNTERMKITMAEGSIILGMFMDAADANKFDSRRHEQRFVDAMLARVRRSHSTVPAEPAPTAAWSAPLWDTSLSGAHATSTPALVDRSRTDSAHDSSFAQNAGTGMFIDMESDSDGEDEEELNSRQGADPNPLYWNVHTDTTVRLSKKMDPNTHDPHAFQRDFFAAAVYALPERTPERLVVKEILANLNEAAQRAAAAAGAVHMSPSQLLAWVVRTAYKAQNKTNPHLVLELLKNTQCAASVEIGQHVKHITTTFLLYVNVAAAPSNLFELGTYLKSATNDRGESRAGELTAIVQMIATTTARTLPTRVKDIVKEMSPNLKRDAANVRTTKELTALVKHLQRLDRMSRVETPAARTLVVPTPMVHDGPKEGSSKKNAKRAAKLTAAAATATAQVLIAPTPHDTRVYTPSAFTREAIDKMSFAEKKANSLSPSQTGKKRQCASCHDGQPGGCDAGKCDCLTNGFGTDHWASDCPHHRRLQHSDDSDWKLKFKCTVCAVEKPEYATGHPTGSASCPSRSSQMESTKPPVAGTHG